MGIFSDVHSFVSPVIVPKMSSDIGSLVVSWDNLPRIILGCFFRNLQSFWNCFEKILQEFKQEFHKQAVSSGSPPWISSESPFSEIYLGFLNGSLTENLYRSTEIWLDISSLISSVIHSVNHSEEIPKFLQGILQKYHQRLLK